MEQSDTDWQPRNFRELLAGHHIPDPQFLEVECALPMPLREGQIEWPVGIYFGVPEEIYHRIPALSNSGIRNLLASPTTFWAGSWMNPDYEYKSAEHFVVGHAYHTLILEGPNAYRERFYVPPHIDDYPKALTTATQYKEAIKAAGGQPVTKVPDEANPQLQRAARTEDWAAQLVALDRSAYVWPDILAKAKARHPGKLEIDADTDREIHIAARMIAQDPELQKAVRNGWPEVTLIWRDPRQGVLMKCRVDYLKFKAVVDLKTYANRNNLSARQAIARAIAEHRYPLQPATYLQGTEAVRELVREHGTKVVHVWGEPSEEALADAQQWALKWASYKGADRWLWIFQQKGNAPVTRGFWHPLASTVHSIAQSMVVDACRNFREMTERYGTDPWLDLAEIDDLHDDEIPVWGLEI
jgi:hypothetical protein